MKLSLFDYKLPPELIAQTPATPRDHSRLLVYNKKTKKITHDYFYNLPKYLKPTDILVFNNSKVLPARLFGQKETGGKAEILLLKEINDSWEVLIGTKHPKPGTKLLFEKNLIATVTEKTAGKSWIVKFNQNKAQLKKTLTQIGKLPLPPYIHSDSSEQTLMKQYQTVYAKKIGSAAAPTAGLHFSKKLLTQIKKLGCKIEFITLHVGLGTFNTVNTENIEDYQIHHEMVKIDQPTIKRLLKAKESNSRIIAVGTTSVRTLEAVLGAQNHPQKAFAGEVGIFIYPGYKFRFVDAMVTNFHLPKSSLLMLVSTFIGRTTAINLYKLAIKLKYRFFSFGDGMFLQ
jgi:S-adenosylmethionine:tRNA ribosyltransferase-isomerase